ncbi:hypothetical protein Tco_0934086, partial [Tanacetum coccineum]
SVIVIVSFLIGEKMGRAKKGKKYTLTNNNDDPASGDDEKLPSQKRRGRPQKPLTDEDVEKMEEDDEEHDHEEESGNSDGKKRKRVKQVKEKGDLVKQESPNGTKSNGFRHIGSRRKNKPHRAAEAGVECR